MDDVLIVGAGPAGLLAAWLAAQRGARRVRVLARGIGTTHLSPGWLGILDAEGDVKTALQSWIGGHPRHPYALAGIDALEAGIEALQDAVAPSGLAYAGDLSGNFLLPTALGNVRQAALAPLSFIAGDLRQPGETVIAAPAGWRDFYAALCAENLTRGGHPARGITFDLPEIRCGHFDPTAPGIALLLEQPAIRRRIATEIKPQVSGAARVGFPAVLGLDVGRATEVWHDLQEQLGLPVFEIPTLPPSVPGMRLYAALQDALRSAGVQVLLDMAVSRGVVENGQAVGAVVPGPVRELTYSARTIILATGGLYGGGVDTDYRGAMWEAIFGLPLQTPDSMGGWFDDAFLTDHEHQIHHTGVYVNEAMRPLDPEGRVVLGNVRVAGRLLGGYNPLREGSTEGVWLATAYKAACCLG